MIKVRRGDIYKSTYKGGLYIITVKRIRNELVDLEMKHPRGIAIISDYPIEKLLHNIEAFDFQFQGKIRLEWD